MSNQNSNSTTVYGGPGFLSLLTLTFVIAKLTGLVSWSWWLVFAPVLLGLGLGLAVILLVLIFALIAAILS
jgi:hypothetical protein